MVNLLIFHGGIAFPTSLGALTENIEYIRLYIEKAIISINVQNLVGMTGLFLLIVVIIEFIKKLNYDKRRIETSI